MNKKVILTDGTNMDIRNWYLKDKVLYLEFDVHPDTDVTPIKDKLRTKGNLTKLKFATAEEDSIHLTGDELENYVNYAGIMMQDTEDVEEINGEAYKTPYEIMTALISYEPDSVEQRLAQIDTYGLYKIPELEISMNTVNSSVDTLKTNVADVGNKTTIIESQVAEVKK